MRQDRLWKIHGPGWVGAITDYNQEITGSTEEMKDVPLVRYSWNVFSALEACQKLGYRIERCEDRR